MSHPHALSLATLYADFDVMSRGRNVHGDSRATHAAILDRLAANGQDATAAGWTALALERDGGLGRLRLIGLPPGESDRAIVPDSAAGLHRTS